MTTILLSRRDQPTSNNEAFTWQFPSGKYQNITMDFTSFKIPMVKNLITFSNLVMVNVKINQEISSTNLIYNIDNDDGNIMLDSDDKINQTITVSELNSITLRFFNPTLPLKFYEDSTQIIDAYTYQQSPSNKSITIILTMPTDFIVQANILCIVYISNFTTTKPTEDSELINLITCPYGNKINKISGNLINISVCVENGIIPTDFKGQYVPGASIYFDSQCFVVPVGITQN